MQTEMLERLFGVMGGREAYDQLYKEKPGLAAELEATITAEYAAAPERSDENIDIFAAAIDPDYVPSKAQIIGGWAHDIDWYLTHDE